LSHYYLNLLLLEPLLPEPSSSLSHYYLSLLLLEPLLPEPSSSLSHYYLSLAPPWAITTWA
jgi:hypothetical protein